MTLLPQLAPITTPPGSLGKRTARCPHCGNDATDASTLPFCCSGCSAVYDLISREHLERYYELRGTTGLPVADARPERRDMKWLEATEAKVRAANGATRVALDIQGLHCSACVWLIEKLFAKRTGALAIELNPTIGRAHLVVSPEMDLRAFVVEIEKLGYLFGPPRKTTETRASALVWRMGVCVALAMNAMIFAIAMYAGLSDGPTYVLFGRLNLALSCASMAVGGTVFIRSAYEGVRRGVLHLDLPIALGIVLAFGGSVVSFAKGRGAGVFVDTLDVFIALMLVGRFLQERVLEKNRLALLANDGALGLLTRKATAAGVETVPCTSIEAGDTLSIAPGDLVPVDATLEADRAAFSLDWINGESRARELTRGEPVPAGAFLASASAVNVRTAAAFDDSPLGDLLRTPRVRPSDAAMSAPWWSLVTRFYVAFVLVAAAAGFGGWLYFAHDFARAIEVATAILVVTCPCAFGIATPLAYDLAQAGLRRAGLFVRSAGFLDRAAHVRTVVFDKTGTLTTGGLVVENTGALAALDAADRDALFTMSGASSHPKSVAVHRKLAALGAKTIEGARVTEIAGKGLVLGDYRFGAPAWTRNADANASARASANADANRNANADADAKAGADVLFGKAGRSLAAITTGETLRPDAAGEVRALEGMGCDVWLLSGDDDARTRAAAACSGIRGDRAVGNASIEEKASFIRAHDRKDLLMIGDGINDAAAVATAFASGTPAVDRPFMAARSDFYFTTAGLRPIRLALAAARKVERVRKRNLALAVAYNALAVALACAGVMSPLLCAVLMPASSLTTILATTFALSKRSPLWRS
jgi:Cu2+-exporting ATPase